MLEVPIKKFYTAGPRTKNGRVSQQRIAQQDDVQLWIDRHKPKIVSDLAVHPKKIEEIKFWLEQNVKRRNGVQVKRDRERKLPHSIMEHLLKQKDVRKRIRLLISCTAS